MSNEFPQTQGSSVADDVIKRPLFVTTVPRGVFLQPQPQVREIVAKPRHVYAFASRPRILDQHHRRELLSKQSSISSNHNQNHIFYRSNNLVQKNIRSYDELVDSRISLDKVDDGTCKVAGVKISRTR
jgi:hypothetical protein